jgi:hypothetical protein
MKQFYDHYRNKYESIKPIRGRSEEVRPIGERRRDWETIRMEGDVVACCLYQTQVVRYYPDGRIGLRTGGWATNSTAEFMHEHAPFRVNKKQKHVWISMPDGEFKYVPVPNKGELVVAKRGNGGDFELATPILIRKKIVDRVKIKAERKRLQPFMKWARAFHAMSDGWLMHSTRKQTPGFLNPNGSPANPPPGDVVYEAMLSDDQEKFLFALCNVIHKQISEDDRLAETTYVHHTFGETQYGHSYNWYDMKFSMPLLKSVVEHNMKVFADVYEVVEAVPATTIPSNVVEVRLIT